MDKKQNLTSFQELTTTELNQIIGGGWWEDFLYRFNIIEQKIQKDFISQYNYKKTRPRERTLGLIFLHSICITVST